MGWNEGSRIFEAQVIAAYDLGRLDKALLAVLMEPYRGTDIDSGGSQGLVTRDGKGVEQVVIETWGLAMPAAPAVRDDEDPEAWDSYNEAVDGLFYQISKRHFGWE